MNVQEKPILLVSFTARMLAELAVKAGYPVLALDYFGDSDLQALCPAISLRHDYKAEYSATALVDAARELNGAAVVYGANLENHPEQIARLAQGRRLLGNSPETLRRVRNPFLLADALQAANFACPKTVSPSQKPADGVQKRWLWKSLKGGGGMGVQFWPGAPPPPPGILQEWLPGMVGSVAFVANGRQAVLLGITEQLVERRAFGAAGFKYCGNLMPPRLQAAQLKAMLNELQALIAHLVITFGLWGVNGLDFIWHQERAWTLEVNPRPSASVELIDIVYGIRVFEIHVRSFTGQLPSFDLAQALLDNRAAGKAILYAPFDVSIDDTSNWPNDGVRDIPHSGEQIKQGHPVCTILTTGTGPSDCLRQLRSKASKIKQKFQPSIEAG